MISPSVEVGLWGSMDSPDEPWRQELKETVGNIDPALTNTLAWFDPTCDLPRQERTEREALHLLKETDIHIGYISPHTLSDTSMFEVTMALVRAHHDPTFPVRICINQPFTWGTLPHAYVARCRDYVSSIFSWMTANGKVGQDQVKLVTSIAELAQETVAVGHTLGEPFKRLQATEPSRRYPIVFTGATEGRDLLRVILDDEHITYTETSEKSIYRVHSWMGSRTYRRGLDQIAAAQEWIIVYLHPDEPVSPILPLGVALAVNGEVPIIIYQPHALTQKNQTILNVYGQALAEEIPPLIVAHNSLQVAHTIKERRSQP